MADPVAVKNYWEVEGLKLDTATQKAATKDTATTITAQVTQLQADLVVLGYLTGKPDGGYGEGTTRAVLRFQRHAARPYRMPQPDAGGAALFTGAATGVCDAATAQEVRKWITNKWVLPLNRFQMTAISVAGGSGKLRSDAAMAWAAIMSVATAKGATLAGPYGDTTRTVARTSKVGTSAHSFHYCGRAVDISQALGGGRGQRYYVVKEPLGGETYWRIWCKTDRQDGSQGVEIKKGTVTAYGFHNWSEYKIPEGYYVDLTALIESTGKFERIKAQSGWNGSYNKTEWWHFQYKLDKQETFLDEMELIGYSEAKLRAAGWNTVDLLDHAPG